MDVLGHGEASAFGGATLVDPDIAALRAKVEVVPYDPPLAWPQDRAVVVSITMDDGGVFEKECRIAHGSPDDPLSEGEILNKARALSLPAFPMLVPVLQEVMEAPEKTGKFPWRSVVSRITVRPASGDAG
jgi:2-methylcitrate dehydratase PrpD